MNEATKGVTKASTRMAVPAALRPMRRMPGQFFRMAFQPPYMWMIAQGVRRPARAIGMMAKEAT
jgi:hypothetical protein